MKTECGECGKEYIDGVEHFCPDVNESNLYPCSITEAFMNKVIRKCNKCGSTDEHGRSFTYLGDGVWSCWECCSKWTHIAEIVKEE